MGPWVMINAGWYDETCARVGYFADIWLFLEWRVAIGRRCGLAHRELGGGLRNW